MKKIKLGLLPQILIAIALGIAAGTISPELPVRVFVTFNALFSQFLNGHTVLRFSFIRCRRNLLS